jgi:predicted phage terminase large subunit-like protein
MTVWGVFTGAKTEMTNRYIAKNNKNRDSETQSMLFDEGVRVKYGRSFTENASPKVMLMDAWEGRYELHQLVTKVAQTCRKMKVDRLLIENKAAGHSIAQELKRLYGYENFAIQLYDPKSQDKLSRLHSVEHLFADGMVFAPNKQWAEMVIRQVSQFPKGKHDDLVDTVSMALRHLRESGVLVRHSEWTTDMENSMMFQGNTSTPLYPV